MSSLANALGSVSSALAELVEKSSQAVVAVKPAAYRVTSGVIFREGLIAVANHALRRADPIPVQFADGGKAEAKLLGRHAGFDLAILKMEGPPVAAPAAIDPASLKAGMLIAVVGLTVDVGPSASVGILGAVGGPRRIWRGGTMDQFLRLDVNLYPSQSGAAVVDYEGRLIGMATPSLLRHSAAAVPLTTLNRIADELLQEGRLRHGYLGIGVQAIAIPEGSETSGEKLPFAGLIVLSIEAESPAGQAKLQLGDILLSLDGEQMTDVEELQAVLKSENIGRTVQALFLRGGSPVRVDLTIAERRQREK